MGDMISRQVAITAIQKAYADTVHGMDKCAVWKNVGLTHALHIMQDLPSAQPERTETHSCDYEHTETHGWIPVTEALPEDGVTVWVTIRGHDVIRCEDGETLEQAIARISKMRRVSEGFWCDDDKT